MDIRNQTEFQVAPLPGRLDYPDHSLTLIVKGTFALAPGGIATLAPEQLPLTGDEPYPDDEEGTGSIRYESDLAHFKPAADAMLVGTCHTPGAEPLLRCPVTYAVGPHVRTLMVSGERFFRSGFLGTKLGEALPFTTMELRWENSFGGPGHAANPVGKGFGKTRTEAGEIQLLPNIEDPRDPVTSPRSRPAPAGFAPVARSWAPRTAGIGKYGDRWLASRAPWFPQDLDWRTFNAAPRPMQIEGYLRGDEELRLENLHAEYPRYTCQLPGLRVRCFLDEQLPDPQTPSDTAPRFREVDMHLDTLWVDADAEQLVLVWRGHAAVSSDEYEEVRTLVVAAESLVDAPQPAEAYRPAPGPPAAGRPPIPVDTAGRDLLAARIAAGESLAGADLSGLDLSGLDLGGADLGGANLQRTSLRDATLIGARLDGVSAAGADLTGADLSFASLKGADLSRAALDGAVLRAAEASGACFYKARLCEAQLVEMNLFHGILRYADLTGADASGSNLYGADLADAVLAGARMDGANLKKTRLGTR